MSGPVVGSAALEPAYAHGQLVWHSVTPRLPPGSLRRHRRSRAASRRRSPTATAGIRTADAVVAGHVGRKYTWSMPGGSLVAYVIALRDGDAAAICSAPRGPRGPTGMRAAGSQRPHVRRRGHLARTRCRARAYDRHRARSGRRRAVVPPRPPRRTVGGTGTESGSGRRTSNHTLGGAGRPQPTAALRTGVARLAAALKDEAARPYALWRTPPEQDSGPPTRVT